MRQYPGQSSRRWPLALAASVLVALAAAGMTWVFAQGSSGAANGTVCAGGRDNAGRHQAATCLVESYFALANLPAAQRTAQLADLVLPDALVAARVAYKAFDGTVAVEYAAVAATNLDPSPSQADMDVDGQAWVAFVDSFRNASQPPLAQWWITSFELRWLNGRWWLNGGVGLRVNATPQTVEAAQRDGFGSGWVAAGGG